MFIFPLCILRVFANKQHALFIPPLAHLSDLTYGWSLEDNQFSPLGLPPWCTTWYGLPLEVHFVEHDMCDDTHVLYSNQWGHDGHFKGACGLSQGDPLSLYPFTLCLKMFSRALWRLMTWPSFHYHPKCATMEITHLTYTDDLLLFPRGEVSLVSILVECLELFGNMVGLHASRLKSRIYMNGLDEHTKNRFECLSLSRRLIFIQDFRLWGPYWYNL